MYHMGRPLSNIVTCFISDHRPISLQWGKRKFRRGLPFKFNRVRLEDAEFNDLGRKSWSSCLPMENSSPSQALLDNLCTLKVKVKLWQENKRKANRKALKEIQGELDVFAEKIKESDIPLQV